jgi:DNA topoisomerase-1
MNNYYEINDTKNLSSFAEDDQKRIKYLRIPPNWNSIKVTKDPSSKIQVTGKDAKGRTQYIYHPAWVQFSKETKYSKVNSINFTTFENIIKRYSEFNGLYSKNYIIANMFIIMKDLNIRVGNEKYLEENDSVGLCTLSKSHYKKVKTKESNGSNASNIHKFIFKGKKGILHEKILLPKHITFIENIISLPGKSLFKYFNDTNENCQKDKGNKCNKDYKKVTADDLNQFLKEYVDKYMSCKDIRTYCANTIFKREYSKLIKSGTNPKKARIEATKITANELGNTPKVCRDSYIDPILYSE